MTEKRRKRGTGSIYPHRNDTFRAQIRLKDDSGVSHAFTGVFDSESEAETWLDKKLALKSGGTIIDRAVATDGLIVRDFLRLWLDHKYLQSRGGSNLKKISEDTVADYESLLLHHVLPVLGDIELKNLNRANLRQWIETLDSVKVKRTGKAASPSLKHRVTVVFKQSIKYALAHGYIDSNPLEQVDLFTAPADKVRDRAFAEKDYDLFTKHVNSKKCDHEKGYCQLRWNLGLVLARRQGEILSLKWEDINLEASTPTLTINTHLNYAKAQHGCGEPNSDGKYSCGRVIAGYCPKRIGGGTQRLPGTKARQSYTPTLPLTTSLVEQFKHHKMIQDLDIAKAKKNGTISPSLKTDGWVGLVFTRYRNQNPVLMPDDYARFVELCKEAKLSKHYRLHDLRHTGVSRIVSKSGGNIGIAQAIAGHKTIQTTAQYSSPDLKSQLAALNLSE